MERVRVLLIGWDGAEPALVEPWRAQGRLPVLASLADRGTAGRIRSTRPAVTPPAWTSLVTGLDPGRHGIYSFTHPGEGEYAETLVTAQERHGASVWRLLSDAGQRVGVFNLSLSYPPEPLEGFMFAGFDAPVLGPQMAYPPETFALARQAAPGYIHERLEQKRDEACAGGLLRQARQQRDMLRALTRARPVQVLAVNFNTADHVHHQAWPLRHSAEQVVGQGDSPLLEVYQGLDGILGDLLEEYAGEDTQVLVVSDHGGGPLRGQVSLARALEEGGFLRRGAARHGGTTGGLRHAVGRLVPPGLKSRLWAWGGEARRLRAAHELRQRWVAEVDWTRTVAFPWGSSGFVQVNVRGRQPQGGVALGDRARVMAEVSAYLRELRDPATGQAVVGEILSGEETYRAPRVGYCPDLVVEGAQEEWGIMPRWEARGPWFAGGVWNITLAGGDYRGVTACHRTWGLLVTAGPAVQRGAALPELGMTDLAPTLLYLAGVTVPEGLDGAVARSVWDTGEAPRLVAGARDDAETQPRAAGYSREEQARVEERLRDLGYM